MVFTRFHCVYLLSILLTFSCIPNLGMEESSHLNESRKETAARKKRERQERDKQKFAQVNVELDELLGRNIDLLQQADEALQRAQQYLGEETEEDARVPSIEELQEAAKEITKFDELSEYFKEEEDNKSRSLSSKIEENELDEFFKKSEESSFDYSEDEDVVDDVPPLEKQRIELQIQELDKVGEDVEVESAVEPEPEAENINDGEVREGQNNEFEAQQNNEGDASLQEQNQDLIQESNPQPSQKTNHQPAEVPNVQEEPQKIDQAYLAQVLQNILENKVSVLTGGALGVVHYLHESKILDQTITLRSPKMRDMVFEYFLPTLRDALAAHLIQLTVPLLPYIRDYGIRSYGTANYLANYVTSKMLGMAALHLMKSAKNTEQGQKIMVRYKRLPEKTQKTIEKIAPWVDFARNFFMARLSAGFFDSAEAS